LAKASSSLTLLFRICTYRIPNLFINHICLAIVIACWKRIEPSHGLNPRIRQQSCWKLKRFKYLKKKRPWVNDDMMWNGDLQEIWTKEVVKSNARAWKRLVQCCIWSDVKTFYTIRRVLLRWFRICFYFWNPIKIRPIPGLGTFIFRVEPGVNQS
jgi:hypothetical protein